MISPLVYVALFGVLGLWILIDPMPGYILLNFPEVVGRVAFFVYYNVVVSKIVFAFHVRFFPIRSVIFYSDLLEEAILMANTPLGGGEEDGD